MSPEDKLIDALRDYEGRARSTFESIGLEVADAALIVKSPDLDVPAFVRWLARIIVAVPAAIEGLHTRPSAETALLVHEATLAAGRVGIELSRPLINAARRSKSGTATARDKRWAKDRNAAKYGREISKARSMMSVGRDADDILAALGYPVSQNAVKAAARKKFARILRENNALPARRRTAKNG